MPFRTTLRRWPGPSAWVFALIPDEYAPDHAGAFGRVPVVATVDEHTWATSVWRDKSAGWLLAVPQKLRGAKDDGDEVFVDIEVDIGRL